MTISARALACVLLGLMTSANAQTWEMDSAKSSLRFIGEAQGESFEGRFEAFTAEVTFDPASLDTSRIDVVIALKSADSQNEERDELLHSEEFFDSRAQNDATYRAGRFEHLEGDRYRALGELTLKGKTEPVVLEFTWTRSGPEARLDGTATVSRLAHGVGTGDWTDTEMIGDTVKVLTTVSLRAMSPAADS